MMKDLDFTKIDLRDALDLAILIEEEAKERYEELSKMVGGRYEGDAFDVFETMAANEANHGKQLAERRKTLFPNAPPRVDRSMLFDEEAPDYGKIHVFMSPRQAMEVALESEEKAYDFFDNALAHIKDPDVRVLFEELRDEEKEHWAALKEHIEEYQPGPDIEEEDADEPSPL
jgi:rubrerythrin